MKAIKSLLLAQAAIVWVLAGVLGNSGDVVAAPAQKPLFLGGGQPLVMLSMSRDHKLYYEAYNDASDINGDGTLDVGFKENIDYFGYFDPFKCYDWSSGDSRFVPAATTSTKKCTNKWSGNFLNYVTMTRMDAMRKVLYGGYRKTDGDTLTVLERSYIPQDAHSWGKEYESFAKDGYYITDYTPLAQPSAGTRHLFANTTLLSPPSGKEGPLMRVLTNTTYRIWEWVSIERPVAGTKCLHGSTGPDCTTTAWTIVPSGAVLGISGMTQTTYNATGYAGNPADTAAFNALETGYATAAKQCGSQSASTINGSGNPFVPGSASCDAEKYITIFSGTLNVPTTAIYNFAVDGDDAVDLFIDGTLIAGWYGGHGNCNCNDHTGSVTLTAGTHTIKFRHHESGGGDNYYLRWSSGATSTMTDYQVRVEVCKAGLLESDCRGYPRGASTPTIYRPSGLLHEFGEDHTMGFGLITGSYRHNLQGGVLRKNIENFGNEVDATTGKFTSVDGIVKTLNALIITGFGANYEYSCGWKTDGPLNDSNCRMWGNPIGEIMYEGLRYFAGKSGPTSGFSYTEADDDGLALPKATWQNPYRSTSGGYGWCSKPFQMVISDINPSYDSDQLPGSAFNAFSGDLTGLDVSALGQTIWNNESESTNLFIGHSLATQTSPVVQYDGAPTPKNVNSFGNIRGLSPEEPTKQGSYYSASVAYFGNKTLITDPQNLPITGKKQNVQTFAVALASPLPKIEIPITALNKTITFVPFAKSVGGSGISASTGSFQPTNQIVDFYIDTIRNVSGFPTDATVNGGRPYYMFRINYEDVEQGADHDMDAIAEYRISLLADNTVQVVVDSTYAAGGIIQHMGYVVSGTTADGTYLVVRDNDTAAGSDPDYFLDTPNTAGTALPLNSTRVFTAGSTASAAFAKHDPLWYAAKWGGFTDISSSKDNLPNVNEEWSKKSPTPPAGVDRTPDNYFLVTNAGRLKDQLRSAFAEISERTSSASAIAQNSTRLDTDTMIFQARFNTQDWTGQLRAFKILQGGVVEASETWEASTKIPAHGSRAIYTWDPAAYTGNLFAIGTGGLTATQLTSLGLGGATTAADQQKYVDYLRGDGTNEQQNSGGTLRTRSVKLGDIVNSDPVYVFAEDFGYEGLPESQPAVATDPNKYTYFRDVTKAARRKMIYVSSNDGLVHGFDASSNVSTGGVEQFAFVPSVAFPLMKELAQPAYTHQYIVDGPLFAGDAYLNSSWKTILLGTTGAATGKSVFALDITAPDSFSVSNVMWEFTHAELGYPMGQPVIARMPNGRWAAVFGNGYESSAGTAKLFIVYLDPVLTGASVGWTAGTDYCVLEPDNTIVNNGLSTPALLDTDGNGVVDFIYAGDLQGNLWKFVIDATGTGSSDNCPTTKWKKDKKVFQTPAVTCKTRDATGNVSNCSSPTTKRQPITGPLEISAPVAGQTGGYNLFFGTGMYFQDSDVNDMTEQAFYTVWDDGGNSTVALTDMVKQTINTEGALDVITADDPPQTLTFNYRLTSANTVTYPTKKGWYMPLLKPNPDSANPQYQGERIVSAPLLRAGRVVFTTLIPSTDVCAFGGDSWIMELDLASGATTSAPVFDLNNDQAFSSLDKSGSSVISGIKSKEGIVKTPAVISAGGIEYKLASGTTGNILKIVEKGTAAVKRTSWRQVQ